MAWITSVTKIALLCVCADDNIDETYGINVQFEESEDEVCFYYFVFCLFDYLSDLLFILDVSLDIFIIV